MPTKGSGSASAAGISMIMIIVIVVAALVVCVCGLGIFIFMLQQRKGAAPAQAIPNAGATEMSMPVVAMPVGGGLSADQLAKQQSSPGQAIGVVATPQQAQKHSVAI